MGLNMNPPGLLPGSNEADPGARVLIVDDVLATGGTAAAKASLVEKVGGAVAGFAFLIELDFLEGRERLPEGSSIVSLIHVV